VRRLAGLLGLVGLAAGCAGTPPPRPCPRPAAPAEQTEQTAVAPRPVPPAFATIFRSVVQIKVQVEQKLAAGQVETEYEYGTGFFVDERGRILTSAHVLDGLEDPRHLTVLVAGRPLQARVVRRDRTSDLALLSVDAGTTEPLRLAEGPAALGGRVYAVGYPFVEVFTDRMPAVSVGHLAGVDRDIDYAGRRISDLLLTDAFVADGCSGGPLLDEQGHVIGVLRFNLSRDGTWLGLSLAEPIAAYQRLLRDEPAAPAAERAAE
jgi:putative serine protease PepD